MDRILQLLLLTLGVLGSSRGATAQSDANAEPEVHTASLSPDPGYNYASYPSYDYDAVYAATSQEDRQDIGLYGGVGAGVILTAVAAAFLGSLLAPAISVGVGRVMSMEFRLPELPFRALRYDLLDDRSLVADLPWLDNLETVYEAAREALASRKGIKFVKYIE
eukprot:TRINITY_DN36543_c0_g1_i1.p1 TRINITY_DN36543_c0_g1~~TRINITY_DN36543_c0_g1_i1.p1  ORF type:complete len:164 (-),score=28.27 TRINITY_DN36543_c0_g1_i1:104-595(-)